MLYTYDPKAVIITFKGFPIIGYADGTFVTVERSADMYTEVVGARGEVSRAKSNNRTGIAKLTLKQTSHSNDDLALAAQQDEQTNVGVGVFSMQDVLGTTMVLSPQAYVKKMAHIDFAKEIKNREWTLFLSDVTIFVGGNIPTL